MSRRLGICAAFLSLCLFAFILDACGPPSLTRPSATVADMAVAGEPPAAAAFVDAYARGDLALSDRLASPLYRAEWVRRGITLDERYTLLPAFFRAASHPEAWLRFTYVGGLVDDVGFRHLLYTAYSTGAGGDQSPTVWRVDTGPDGQVIWSEMVYLFSDATSRVVRIDGTNGSSADDLRPNLKTLRQRPLIGVQSTRGPEGYYAVGPQSVRATGTPEAPHSYVFFFAVDADGQIRSGAWSYGKPQPGLARTTRPTLVNLAPDQARLLRSYLDTLP